MHKTSYDAYIYRYVQIYKCMNPSLLIIINIQEPHVSYSVTLAKICNLSPLPHLQQVWIQPKVNKNNTKHLAEKCRMIHTVKPQ